MESIILIDDELLTQYTPKNREQVEMIILNQLVSKNHLVRKVEADIDFSFISSVVENAYSAERGGCPSIVPVVCMKMTLFNKCSIFAEHVFIDSIHVKASANKSKFEKKVVHKETKIDLHILYTIFNNQWNFAAATRLLREIEERLRPRRRSRGGSASSPRKASGCSAMERTCSSNVTQ